MSTSDVGDFGESSFSGGCVNMGQISPEQRRCHLDVARFLFSLVPAAELCQIRTSLLAETSLMGSVLRRLYPNSVDIVHAALAHEAAAASGTVSDSDHANEVAADSLPEDVRSKLPRPGVRLAYTVPSAVLPHVLRNVALMWESGRMQQASFVEELRVELLRMLEVAENPRGRFGLEAADTRLVAEYIRRELRGYSLGSVHEDGRCKIFP